MDSAEKLMTFVVCASFAIVALVILGIVGNLYKDYKLEAKRIEAQAAGKIPPPNVQIRKLDDEQFRLLLEALQNKEQK